VLPFFGYIVYFLSKTFIFDTKYIRDPKKRTLEFDKFKKQIYFDEFIINFNQICGIELIYHVSGKNHNKFYGIKLVCEKPINYSTKIPRNFMILFNTFFGPFHGFQKIMDFTIYISSMIEKITQIVLEKNLTPKKSIEEKIARDEYVVT
jgi:hypothetical protein